MYNLFLFLYTRPRHSTSRDEHSMMLINFRSPSILLVAALSRDSERIARGSFTIREVNSGAEPGNPLKASGLALIRSAMLITGRAEFN